MSGETEQNVSGWTVDTLHSLLVSELRHLESALAERDTRYEQRFQAQEQSIDKAETATEKRFAGVNEFRQTLADQARDLMPRLEVEQVIKSLAEKIDQQTHAANVLTDQRYGANSTRIDALDQRIHAIEASGVGLRQAWAYVIGAIGAVGGVIAIVFALASR